jgi:hypothetical protein
MESSGPEGGKVRGPAAMVHERYLQLARDASSSGDRVLSENYLQHADHYFRLWRSIQPAAPPPQMNDRFEDGAEGDEDAGGDVEAGEEGDVAADGGEQPDVEFPQGERQQFDRDGGRGRGRGRRSRYRPNEGEGGEPREAREGGEREGGGEQREARSEPRENRGEAREGRGEDRGERRERRERQPRERDENAGPEGFSSGPKPAFLRGGD